MTDNNTTKQSGEGSDLSPSRVLHRVDEREANKKCYRDATLFYGILAGTALFGSLLVENADWRLCLQLISLMIAAVAGFMGFAWLIE